MQTQTVMNNFYQQFLRNCQSGVPVEITLAAPSAHTDTCTIHLAGEYVRANHSSTVLAYLRIDEPTGRLLIHFLRRSIITARQSAYFENDLFKAVGNQFLSPGAIKSLGGGNSKCQLVKGFYPILADADYFTISARLSNCAAPGKMDRCPRRMLLKSA